MNIFLLELKRLMKTRITWISMGIAVLISIAIAFSSISNEEYDYATKNNSMGKVTGLSAIKANKKQTEPFEGKVTVENLQSDLRVFHSLVKKYGNDIPYDLYCKEIIPRMQRLNLIVNVYSKGSNIFTGLNNVYPDDIKNFYLQRNKALQNELEAKYPKNSAVKQQAMSLNNKVKTPFVYNGGFSSANNLFDLDFLIFLLALICIIINSSIFSGDYQTGADDILRTTKHGRAKLALSKICASILIDLVLFAICISIFVLIIGYSFGWDSLMSSIQVFIPYSFLPITVGQEQKLIILAGLLSILAIACFTMFFSSICRNSTTSLIIAIAFCLFPDILYLIMQGSGNLSSLLGSILPSGGLGTNNNFYLQTKKMIFLQVGSFSIWSPYIIMGASIIEIPIFFILSVRAYCKHQVA